MHRVFPRLRSYEQPKDPALPKHALRLIVLKRFQVVASPSCPPLTVSSAKPSLQPTLKQQHLCDLSSALRQPATVFTLFAELQDRYDIYTPRIATFLQHEILVPLADEERVQFLHHHPRQSGSLVLRPALRRSSRHLKHHVPTFASGELKPRIYGHIQPLAPHCPYHRHWRVRRYIDVFAQNSFDPPA
ncbi:hypothetical protein D9619_011425 [Psilocybe cf. subviscida]|uniref:Uncharacterized protein n=1 Tax=Psilocybe cf. subviscida TaxID=2480587 RepID=A0A8H5BK06_9AGAR|nr:hypothetical protein D9619_011425 [Psilocybe cf. subviscida]